MVDEPDQGQEDGLARGGLDDGRFPSAGRVEVDVGAFGGVGFGDFEVEEFDDVADQVGELSWVR